MRLWAVFCLCFLLVDSRKEKESPLEQLLDDPELLRQVVKRLGLADIDLESEETNTEDSVDTARTPDGNDNIATDADTDTSTSNQKNNVSDKKEDPTLKSIEDSDGNSCYYKKSMNTIIRTNVSLRHKETTFLRLEKSSNEASCIQKCCYIQGCTLAVFENKGNNSCYFFNCGSPSKCVFAEHSNYISMTLKDHVKESPNHGISSPNKDHENDLQGLGKGQSTVTPVTTPEPQITPVALFGKCDLKAGDKCVDMNSDCVDGTCQCKETFHAKYGVCRRQCSDRQFECVNKDQTGIVPECIDRSHVCDDIPQCVDGSDELKCPAKDLHKEVDTDKSTSKNNKPSKAPKKTEVVNSVENKPTTKRPPVVTTLKTRPAVTKKTTPKVTQNVQDKSKVTNTVSNKNTSPKVPIDEVKSSSKATSKTEKAGQKTDSVETEKSKTVAIYDEETGMVVVESPSGDSAQGPIIALSLGLAFTLMLLVFVGCRLRNVKRKIRKGRPLHSNEADYLINGMYL